MSGCPSSVSARKLTTLAVADYWERAADHRVLEKFGGVASSASPTRCPTKTRRDGRRAVADLEELACSRPPPPRHTTSMKRAYAWSGERDCQASGRGAQAATDGQRFSPPHLRRGRARTGGRSTPAATLCVRGSSTRAHDAKHGVVEPAGATTAAEPDFADFQASKAPSAPAETDLLTSSAPPPSQGATTCAAGANHACSPPTQPAAAAARRRRRVTVGPASAAATAATAEPTSVQTRGRDPRAPRCRRRSSMLSPVNVGKNISATLDQAEKQLSTATSMKEQIPPPRQSCRRRSRSCRA